MRIRTFLCISLAVLLLSLTGAAVKTVAADNLNESGQNSEQTDQNTENDAQAIGQLTETETSEVSLPNPKGVDSVKTLLEISLDYFHNGCDVSKIEKYQDPQAYIAVLFIEDLYRDEDLSFQEAMDKAELIYGNAEDLEKADPELAAAIMDEIDVMDPEEFVSEFMTDVRDGIRSGEISESDPNYETYYQMLTDWDKGAAYMLEHYPLLQELADQWGVAFGMEGAMDLLRRFGRLELYTHEERNDYFRDLQCEYKPENTFVNSNGYCAYNMGSVIVNGSEAWSVDMMYYVQDCVYYLIGYSYALGSVGG